MPSAPVKNQAPTEGKRRPSNHWEVQPHFWEGKPRSCGGANWTAQKFERCSNGCTPHRPRPSPSEVVHGRVRFLGLCQRKPKCPPTILRHAHANKGYGFKRSGQPFPRTKKTKVSPSQVSPNARNLFGANMTKLYTT